MCFKDTQRVEQLSEVGVVSMADGKGEEQLLTQAPPGTAQGTPGAASSLLVSFPASISAQVLLTQCHLQFLGTGSCFWRFLSISFYRVGFNVGFWGVYLLFLMTG